MKPTCAWKLSLVGISMCVCSSTSYAATIYVEPATGSDVSPAELNSTTELVKNSVANVGGHTLAEEPGSAELVLQPKLLRLGESYILTLTKLLSGKVAYSSQLKASKIEELDKVAERLTRSVLIGERAVSNPRVGEITNEEAKEGTQRRPVRTSVFLGFGPANFVNLNSPGIGYSFGVSYSWDTNYVRIKLLADGDFNGSAFFIKGGLGGNFYFTTTDIAPYLSADFGAGAASSNNGGLFNGQTVGGFALGVGAGVELLRTSAVNLEIGIRAGFILNSNSYGTPQSYTLRLGLYF